LIGNPPVREIDSGVAVSFRFRYLKLPKYWDRNEPATANKHKNALIEYWDYLVRNSKLPLDLDNPFRGHMSAKNKLRAARDERPMWSAKLNYQLVASPVFTGCFSVHRRKREGREIHRDALFWVTLLGRFTGAREDELCSLTVGDIDVIETEIGPVWHLNIRDSKTEGGSRDLPIPEETLKMGLLEFRVFGLRPSSRCSPS
jgi:integrase